MPAIVQEVVSLVGELLAFRAVGSDGWGVGTLAVGTERHSFTGKVLGARPGSTVELQGVWSEHERYGKRLKVRQCVATTPQSVDGVVAWLITTLPGVGEKRARELVARFGAELWNVIDKEAQRLCEVAGISPAMARRIVDEYEKHRADRDHMVALRGWGLTDSQIGNCLKRWRSLEEVVEAIRTNPYQLSRTVFGFGFKRADAVAMKAGVAYDSEQRIAAALEHLMEESGAAEGHTFLPFGELKARGARLIGVDAQAVAKVLRSVLRAGDLVRHGKRIYAKALDQAESDFAQSYQGLLDERAS